MTVIPIVRLPRMLPKAMAEEHSLFLCRKAATLGAQSDTLRETLKQLCASENAAIADAALQMLGPVRMLK